VRILHIGKTAGTALSAAVRKHRDHCPQADVIVLSHTVTLQALAIEQPDAKVVFFVRDPIERFISGFYSRLRQGLPRYNSPWSREELIAFGQFITPNQLGEALASDSRKEAAAAALNAITHARLDLRHYLGSVELLEGSKENIIFIGEQSSFDADFRVLRKTLGMHEAITPPSDDIGAHRNPADVDRWLSPLARRALHVWFADDYPIYQWCQQRRKYLLGQ